MVQSTVTNEFLATGIPGEFSQSANQDSQGAILKSGTEADNLASRALHYLNGSSYEVGIAANGGFAGILITPKASIRPTLDALDYIPNETQIEVAKRGYLFVTLPAPANRGDFVYFLTADGSLLTADPADPAPADSQRLAGGIVVGQNVDASGVGEIYFDIAGSTVATA